MTQRVTLPCDELRTRYAAGQSTTALARHYGCSPTTVAKQLRACGVEVRDARFQPLDVDLALLRRLYLDERLPIAEIAARLGISVASVGNLRRRANIPTRPRHRADRGE